MFDIKDEARLQATAGTALLTNSRLLRWSDRKSEFQPATHRQFEGYSTKSLDPYFGRVMRWILFSTGAEFLIKALCLVHDIEIRASIQKAVPAYPESPFDHWARRIQDDLLAGGKITTTYFGTLADLRRTRPLGPHIDRLAAIATQDPDQRAVIRAAVALLTETIRNRDAHAYVPNVRENHFELVKDLFVPVLNTLVTSLPGGPDTLTHWRNTHGDFIRRLPSTTV